MTEPDAERSVAIAIFAATGDEPNPEAAFDALTADEQAQFLEIAKHAIGAYANWLTEAGFRIAPPGTMLRPKTENDARAMLMAAKEFLAKPRGKKALLARPSLVGLNGQKLQ